MPNALKSISNFFSRRPNGSGARDQDARSNDSAGSTPNSGICEVWLHPDSDELGKQTALSGRKIEQPVFRIGRRVSDSVNYMVENAPDLLIFENEPFTLSKLHCQIELKKNKVVLRDMGSRLGTRLGKKRLRSNERESSSIVVPKGTHTLTLGRRDGPFRFRLVVS